MRDLNECKAEVFRRSEKRIKERRKIRNRALALCIPLCLLILLSSSMIPGMLFEGSGDAPEGGENTSQGSEFWESVFEGSGVPDHAEGGADSSAPSETESDSEEESALSSCGVLERRSAPPSRNSNVLIV